MTLTTFANGPWRFDVTDQGPADGPCVILLHGFPADRHCWEAVTPALHQAGYRTLAPDQRGYSPGARPPKRADYRMGALVGDVLALADAAGTTRFHVVGHDWGAPVAWNLAARHPTRVRSVTGVSVPHPRAFAEALRHLDQLRMSWYMAAFQVPVVPEWLLGLRQGAFFRQSLERTGLGPDAASRYAQRAAAGGLRGPLNWYRALPLDAHQAVPPVEVPALFVWGNQDRFCSARAAAACHRWLRGPSRIERLPGESHWIPETAPATLAHLLVEHLAAVD